MFKLNVSSRVLYSVAFSTHLRPLHGNRFPVNFAIFVFEERYAYTSICISDKSSVHPDVGNHLRGVYHVEI